MGLTPGTRITLIKSAPLGDPVEVRLRGYELSLRKEDMAQIKIGETLPQKSRPVFEESQKVKREIPADILARIAQSEDAAGEYEKSINTAMDTTSAMEGAMRRAHRHERVHHHQEYDERVHDTRTMRIALAGNPNSGKTTLFNALTGSNQYVGNWPGVTVEQKEGTAHFGRHEITIVDLPGVYSLSPYSMEEIISRNFIVGTMSAAPPDAIINIVDATNLERNLYLTVQLLELEKPMVLALNFMDEARAAGDQIDVDGLSQSLGIPIVPIIAKTGENLDELLRVAHRQMHLGYTLEPDNLYDDFTHKIHHAINAVMHDNAYASGLPAHWASIKLLEGDDVIKKALNLSPEQEKEVEEIIVEYEASGEGLGDREALVADSRYEFIEKAVAKSVQKGTGRNAVTLSEKIDRYVTHKFLAFPIFLFAMFVMFNLTFGPIGSFLSEGVAGLMDSLSAFLEENMADAGIAAWLTGLVTGGVIPGVGGVLSFLPQIALLFFFLSLLEDSGYMARAAFIMDRLLRRFGLSGKAFIPMLMGFGCSVPAIMGARTMENEKDRRMTILLIPFMSCSAKLPVYGLIASAFFGRWAGIVIFCLYVTGMLVAVLSGLFFKKALFSGEPAAFVLELPPYRVPTARNTLMHVWERVRAFIVRAGTVILVVSIALWFLQSFDRSLHMTDDASASLLGAFGSFIAPVFRPLGFGQWQASVAIVTGFIAKEAVVASLAMFYGFSLAADPSGIASAMDGFSPLSAFSMLIYVLLYVPCVAAVAAIYREMNSLKWTAFSVAWQLTVAWVSAFIVYSVGSLLF